MAKNHKKKQKSKAKAIVGYIVIAIVVIAVAFVGVIAYNNRHNIKALYSASRSSSEEIAERQEKNRQKTQEILDSMTEADINELPEEVREMMQTGEITPEESLAIILGETTAEEVLESKGVNSGESGLENPKEEANKTKEGKASEGKAADDKDAESKNTGDGANNSVDEEKPASNDAHVSGENSADDGVSEEKPQSQPTENVNNKEKIIAKIYLLRAEYLNKIDAFIQSGKDTLKTIKPEDWTMSKKMSLISQFGEQGKALEASCDSRMEELLGELETELKRLGESTAPIGEIRKSYEEQKQLKKEELFSLYYPD